MAQSRRFVPPRAADEWPAKRPHDARQAMTEQDEDYDQDDDEFLISNAEHQTTPLKEHEMTSQRSFYQHTKKPRQIAAAPRARTFSKNLAGSAGILARFYA